YDPARDFNDSLEQALAQTQCRFLVMSFTTDWRFSPARSEEIVNGLVTVGRDVSYAEIDTDKGHDAFLVDIPEYLKLLGAYMHRVAVEVENAAA
ncbi:MAG: homoserine O-acetyltransferase, partial [Alcanivoracaceae bacterium]|nr:homoserine O-acetyltransferase [Alcanivoracaceae bacterium]